MSAPANPFNLAGWRRIVAAHYAAVREASIAPAVAAAHFRDVREGLFRQHPESPIAPDRRAAWRGLTWYAHDPAWRVVGTIEPAVTRSSFEISLASDGMLRCTRVGHVHFAVAEKKAALAVYWLEGYGGGIWLPFADATNGAATDRKSVV